MKTITAAALTRRASGVVLGLIVFAAAIAPLAEAAARIVL
jgi:hypothetical protein